MYRKQEPGVTSVVLKKKPRRLPKIGFLRPAENVERMPKVILPKAKKKKNTQGGNTLDGGIVLC